MRMEPYRIGTVVPIPATTRGQREDALKMAGYNLFRLPADMMTIDLLTDSETGALSAAQQAAGILGDETYAGSRSFTRFHEALTELTSYPHILPVHQGRAAEKILFDALLTPGQIVISNTHFDTTAANVELARCEARDLPCPQADDLDSSAPFKGDIDLAALQDILTGPDADLAALVILTITFNNGRGGQPVSMANIHATAALCRDHQIPFYLDAARFAENAHHVTAREPAYTRHTPRQIAEEAFQAADGALVSLKKDAFGHISGFLGLRDPELAAQCAARTIAWEGYTTYGGLTGRDMEILTQGLQEATNPHYLRQRADSTAHLTRLINRAGVATVRPAAIHGVYLDAARLLPHVPAHQFPGHALACALFLEGGIRTCEMGSLFHGDIDSFGDLRTPARHELVRMAIPRRTYTQAHLECVAAVVKTVVEQSGDLPGYRITECPPLLRHFTCVCAPIHAGQKSA